MCTFVVFITEIYGASQGFEFWDTSQDNEDN